MYELNTFWNWFVIVITILLPAPDDGTWPVRAQPLQTCCVTSIVTGDETELLRTAPKTLLGLAAGYGERAWRPSRSGP